MILHLFNSSGVAGPETLVIPALPSLGQPVELVFLNERRRGADSPASVDYARAHGLKVHEVTVRSRLDRDAIQELSRLFHKLGPRIVHAHDVKASTYSLAASPGRKIREHRLISTHHGVRGRPGVIPKLYEKFYTRAILPHYDRILSVCSTDQTILLNRGLRPDQLTLHLNGVDRREVNPAERARVSAQLRSDWGLSAHDVAAGTFLLGMAGRLSPEKRYDKVLDTVAALDRRLPSWKWKLLCFGTGPLESVLRQRTRRLAIEHRVRWMGFRKGLGNEMAGLDLLLSLSDAEGLPINLIEAGWAGTPVLATRVDGNLDLISPPDDGILVDPSCDTEQLSLEIHQLIMNPERRLLLGNHLQSKVRSHFSGTAWLQQLRRIYAEV